MDPTATAGLFNADARLYRLQGEGVLASLQVEGWIAREAFEGKAVLDIVRHVLDGYEGYVYRLAADVEPALAGLKPRPYTTQYRETDYDFLMRLLAEAGLGWTVLE
ncbi:contractile injection system protein, VgrG/Pvc8 family, partial [Achromobacter sp. 2789STDY5608615]|uniref:contractile injection system protein, VgrG/Pvc8 family n=1 Tax=Achromobacter sp. 2789STDY5608615 TaxID=1806492 RepID=UPI000B025236